LTTAALAATALPAMAASGASSSAAGGAIALAGSAEAAVAHAGLLHAHDPNAVINFTVALPLQNKTALAAPLKGQYTKGSPAYHHWLKPGQFAQQFSPSPTAYNVVMQYLQTSGLTVRNTYGNRMLIDVSGSTRQIDNAFHIAINDYQLAGRQFFAPSSNLQIPAMVSPFIQAVFGLSAYAQMHSEMQQKPGTTAHQLTATSGYTPSQIETAYNYNPLYSQGINGSGETIGILTAYTYNQSDINSFDQAFGLPSPSVTQDNIDGTPTQTNPETTLDLEWSSATAPGASVIMYQGADGSLATFTDVYNAAATADAAQVLSTSWGTAESNMSQSKLTADDNIFSQMASQGQSVFAASGDNGATDGTSSLAVDYPWSEPSWQTGANVTQDGQRQTPDIALNADPNTGYSFYYSGAWNVAGGTSFVAPQMTATFAQIDQDLSNQGYSAAGQADPAIYQDAANFVSDIG